MHGKSSLDPIWKIIRQDGSTLPGLEHPGRIMDGALRTGESAGPFIIGVF